MAKSGKESIKLSARTTIKLSIRGEAFSRRSSKPQPPILLLRPLLTKSGLGRKASLIFAFLPSLQDLIIESVTRSDKGMYQCVVDGSIDVGVGGDHAAAVSSGGGGMMRRRTAQAEAVLVLGGN